MKKILLSFMLMIVAQCSFGQNISDFVNKFKTNPACQFMPISKEMIPMVASQAPDEAKPFFEKISGMDMMIFGNRSDELKTQMSAELAKLENNGYLKHDASEREMPTVVYMKMENDVAKEIMVMAEQGAMCMVMVIKGEYTMSDLQNLK